MSRYRYIAKPYARAVFELAREQEAMGAWSQMLEALALVAGHPEVEKLAASPLVTQARLQELFAAVIGNELKGDYAHFLALLIHNKRLYALPDIAALFAGYKAEAENMTRVTVESAFEVDNDFLEQVKKRLEKRFNSTIDIETRLNPALIGGAVIRAGDFIIDGSIKGKLERFSQSLLS